eukprot:CAMPEP_0117425826 /NCGR_PEP_ID=MMETSP0758-20121206/6051_1 /TAXON_ID=63605 /ORGANISM="Percolomonas cosmopolitus, Strain AE-1 (ATCC 50343)" /LENGTH=1146 /DNA_ID=CAMNT_0005210605 /DNA_START=317 /DNA_END=3757 /DNA_ORIENTATION=-
MNEGETQVVETDGYATRDIFLVYKTPADATDGFKIVVDATIGDPDIYLKANSTPSVWVYDKKSMDFGSDIIKVEANDPIFAPSTTYYILVHGYMAYHKVTRFVAVGTSLTGYTDLIQGMVTGDSVSYSDLNYYRLFWAPSDSDLHLSLKMSDSFGDADLYVDTDNSEKPGPSHYKWKHIDWGNDELVIPEAEQTTYYIAVRGIISSKYTLTPFEANQIIQLGDGRPYQFTLQPGEKLNFVYRFFGEQAMDLTFQLSNSGAVTTYPRLPNFYVSSHTHRPNSTDYENRGSRYSSTTTISKKNADQPNYFMTIENPIGDNKNYSLILTASSLISKTRLFDGLQNDDNIVGPDQYKYFTFRSFGNSAVTFSINPTQGEVDLFVSTQLAYPTKDNCNNTVCWTSENYHADAVIIEFDDAIRTSDRFSIGVRGTVDTNQFSIIAHRDANYTLLNPGESKNGAVGQNKRVYYKYHHFKDGPFSIDLNVPQSNSDVDLYLSQCSVVARPDEITCADSNKCIKSEKFGNDQINVENGKPIAYCVGVIGKKDINFYQPIQYTITASSGYLSLSTNGAARYISSTFVNEENFFHLPKPVDQSAGSQLLVGVTLLEGDTILYMKNNSNPDADNWDIVDDGWPSNAMLFADDTESPEYQFKVLSEAPSTYFVTVTNNAPYSASPLQENVPRISVASSTNYMYYKIMLCPDDCDSNKPLENDYQINLKVLNDALGVYVNQDFGKFPTADNAIIKSEGKFSRTMFVNSTRFNQGYVYIGFKGLDNTVPRFVLSVTKVGSSIILADDVSHLQSPTTQAYTRYMRKSNNVAIGTYFVVDSCSNEKAKPFYYADSDHSLPTPENNQYKSSPQKEEFSQFITAELTQAVAQNLYVPNDPKGSYEIYSYTKHYGPELPMITNLYSKHEKDSLHIAFAASSSNTKFPNRGVIYDMYVHSHADIVEGKSVTPKPVNFITKCAARNLGEFVGTVDGTGKEIKEIEIPFTNWNMELNYQITVLVRDRYGLSNKYDSKWLLRNGIIADNYEPVCNNLVASSKSVCNGQGKCVGFDTCSCNEGYSGSFCEIGGDNNSAWKVVVGILVSLLLIGLGLLVAGGIVAIVIAQRKTGFLNPIIAKFKGKSYAQMNDYDDDENPFAVTGHSGYDEI